jgi:hypothetical protein
LISARIGPFLCGVFLSTFVPVNKIEREGWMSQSSSEKFLYFTVGLLKGSAALDALRQDATKHHMVDQPGQLIALRITEYYEMMNQGIVQPVVRVPAALIPLEAETSTHEHISPAETSVSQQSFPGSFSPSGPLNNVPTQRVPASGSFPPSGPLNNVPTQPAPVSGSFPPSGPLNNVPTQLAPAPVSFQPSASSNNNTPTQPTPVPPVSGSFPPSGPLNNGPAQPVSASADRRSESALSQLTGRMRAMRKNPEAVVSVSPAAEKNADEAADYWSTL